MATTLPARASLRAVESASRSASPRRTLKAPIASMIGPSGHQKSSDFAMNRTKRVFESAIPRGQGSKFEWWPAASTNPPGGRFSRPRTS